MTNRKLLLAFIVLMVFVFFWTQRKLKTITNTQRVDLPAEIKKTPQKINGRTVISRISEPSVDKTVAPTNPVSPHWEKNLTTTLEAQAGSSLQEVDVKRLDSFVWSHGGINLNVESVQVKIKDKNGAETSFRALVDSQTGKLLQSWGQTVHDPLTPSENFGVKLDPRYHQD